ncbi:hypothetical protein DPMN_091488 [Dreissena polymorpha]|uniref:Uncharacterized protein n=1 Tax=Dreissena polymorpha TaxID=45954 RepID=A0A9D4KZL7_DREPO|nr:hypothetical protein DPMN_091488 [Dreissena polymorpha]
MAKPIVVSNEIIESKIPLPPPRRSKKIKAKEIGTSKEIIPGSNNVSDMRMTGDNDESQYLNENKSKVEEEKDEDNSELKTENDDYDYVYPDYKGEDNDSAEAHSMH